MSEDHEGQPGDWWRGSVIYQIYPRSFYDGNGDGIGDLEGISAKLDYVARLGVDGIWISPFFRSPMKDFGYDVSNHRDVDPIFGTLADFDRLVERAHALGLKVLIDQVISHTSDQHPWFVQSRAARDGERADWYVWADARPDGTPPNNWLALFGGPAWTWEPRRRQYYLHNFLASQPDLNFHNPAVREQMLAEVQFWLERGVDGFRLDTVNFYFHDLELRDNPPRPSDSFFPYAHQSHIYSRTRPENIHYLRDIRALLDCYPGATSIGEIGSEDPLPLMAAYTSGGDKLHMAYTFALLNHRFGADYMRDIIATVESKIGDGWPCWCINNHDSVRAMTRWGQALGCEDSDELAKLLMAMLLSLRGSFCIYQGEELGLPQVEVPREAMQDPFGMAFWPLFPGRDGCRTPMPWSAEGPHAGFSTAEPWLRVAIPDRHRARAVAVQEQQTFSVLHAYRRFLRWRRHHPALCLGGMELIEHTGDILAFRRMHGRESILAAFNLSPAPAQARIAGGVGVPLEGHGFTGVRAGGTSLEMPPFGVYFGLVPAGGAS